MKPTTKACRELERAHRGQAMSRRKCRPITDGECCKRSNMAKEEMGGEGALSTKIVGTGVVTMR